MNIYHFFQGNMVHISPEVIKSFLISKGRDKLCLNENDKFVFVITMFEKKVIHGDLKEDPYTPLFKEYEHTDFILVNSEKDYLRIIRNIAPSDKIVFHSWPPFRLFIKLNVFLLLFRRRLLSRCSYICWGSDFKIADGGLKTWFSRIILQFSFNRYAFVDTLTSAEVDELKALYPKANVVNALYPSSSRYVFKEKIHSNGDKPTVMVSHSGWPHNYHLHSFDLLSQFKGKIQVVCPLCYGDEAYINEVIERGQSVFGSDFHFFTELKDREDYKEFLRTIDIYVTSAETQTGLGAIFYSMESGTKIFIKGDLLTSLAGQNYIVFDTESIKDIDFDNFSKPLKKDEAIANIDNLNLIKYEGADYLNVWRQIVG